MRATITYENHALHTGHYTDDGDDNELQHFNAPAHSLFSLNTLPSVLSFSLPALQLPCSPVI